MSSRERAAEAARRTPPGGQDATAPFRSAESWLAARGIERQPLAAAAPAAPPETAVDGAEPDVREQSPADGEAPFTSRDAERLASQSRADAMLRDAESRALPDPAVPRVEDDVADALAFVRRSANVAPQSEGRLAAKLRERGWPPVVVESALVRARRERLVDDVALATALVDERRAKGHAIARIRKDLHARGFTADTLDAVLVDLEREDPEATAFDLAQGRAARMTALPAEKAFSRVVGFLLRRGYPEGLARKVSREAVFTTRDDERVIGR